MNTLLKSSLVLCFSLVLGMSVSMAADQDRDQEVYGWQLMTQQEREQHREKMREMKTEQEREKYRQEHHEEMEARAKEKGVKLPDTPMQRGTGMGQGGGMGSGGGGRR